MAKSITLGNVQKALNEIRHKNNLRYFQRMEMNKFKKKYNIDAGQVNFLIAVVAAERIKNLGIFS